MSGFSWRAHVRARDRCGIVGMTVNADADAITAIIQLLVIMLLVPRALVFGRAFQKIQMCSNF